MKSHIFITGATGLIGSNLTKELVKQGHHVTILKRKDSHHPFLKSLHINVIEGDLTNRDLLQKSMNGCDTIYHLAAKISFLKRDYPELHKVNVLGTRNLLEAALNCKVKKFVHASSITAIAPPSAHQRLLTEKTIFPFSEKKPSYAYSKWLAEQEVFCASQKGLNASIANISSVYGQGEMSLNMGRLIQTIYTKPVFIAPPGGCSVIAVDDVVTGLIALAQRGQSRERYILTNENLPYQHIFSTIAQIVKNRPIKITIPKITAYPAIVSAKILEHVFSPLVQSSRIISEDIVKSLFRHRYADNTKAREKLAWKPQVSFKTAVEKAFAFYQTQKLF